MKYYDLKKNWRRVRPHLDNTVVCNTLVRDFNKYTFGRWLRPFEHGMVPADFGTCSWLVDIRPCVFHKYVKHAACHWLVNFALELARRVSPRRQWRVITSDKHSTVWDGADTLFDFNFQAMGVPADKCFEDAHDEVLLPGKHMKVGLVEHFSADVRDLASHVKTVKDDYFVGVFKRAIDSGLTPDEAEEIAAKIKSLKRFRAKCLGQSFSRPQWPALAATGELSPEARVERLNELASYADRKAGRSRSPRDAERYEKLAAIYRDMAAAEFGQAAIARASVGLMPLV
jgi:hypothetical protein